MPKNAVKIIVPIITFGCLILLGANLQISLFFSLIIALAFVCNGHSSTASKKEYEKEEYSLIIKRCKKNSKLSIPMEDTQQYIFASSIIETNQETNQSKENEQIRSEFYL